jgi:hypothetical protein
MEEWKLFTRQLNRQGYTGHPPDDYSTHPSREAALVQARLTDRRVDVVLRIEGPNGQIITRAEIDQQLLRATNPLKGGRF